jgi:hypothetical protein
MYQCRRIVSFEAKKGAPFFLLRSKNKLIEAKRKTLVGGSWGVAEFPTHQCGKFSFKHTKKGVFWDFLCTVFNSAASAAPQIPYDFFILKKAPQNVHLT